METEGETRKFLESIQIPCDGCGSITCDGFCDEWYAKNPEEADLLMGGLE